MCRFRRHALFRKRDLLLYALAGLCLAAGTLLLDRARAPALCLILAGCWGFSAVANTPARESRKVLENLGGKFPLLRFSFTEEAVTIRFPSTVTTLRYEDVARLGEDRSFCYLLMSSTAVYLFEKSAAPGWEELRSFLSARTGKSWSAEKTAISINLYDLFR